MPRPGPRKPSVTFRLSAEKVQALDGMVQSGQARTRSELIDDAIDLLLAQEPPAEGDVVMPDDTPNPSGTQVGNDVVSGNLPAQPSEPAAVTSAPMIPSSAPAPAPVSGWNAP